MKTIRDRINLNARRSAQYVDAYILSSNTIEAILADEQDYLDYIALLEEQIKDLKKGLKNGDQR